MQRTATKESSLPNDRRAGPVAWLFYTIVLPLLFTAVMVGVLLQVLGFNLLAPLEKEAARIPVINHWFFAAKETKGAHSGPAPVPVWRTELIRDAARLAALRAQVARVSRELAGARRMLAVEEARVKADEAKLSALALSAKENAKLATVYTNMSPNQAALIIEALPIRQQVGIFRAMDPVDQASILADMPAAQAAKVMEAGG